jgi:hypothetical protein
MTFNQIHAKCGSGTCSYPIDSEKGLRSSQTGKRVLCNRLDWPVSRETATGIVFLFAEALRSLAAKRI